MNEKHLKYDQYAVEDFAADPDFVQWVKNPDDGITSFWENWLMQHPHKRPVVDEARALVRSIGFSQPAGMQEAIGTTWDRIKATNSRRRQAAPAVPIRKPLLWKMAAAFIALLLVAAAALYNLADKTETYRTRFGETTKIQLPDGSVVTLNANSALKVGTWGENDREVWLKGEAFFSVRKKMSAQGAGHPVKFVVHTSTLDVNVLGTEFTVSERSKTMVVLNTGKIELTLPDKSITMKPGDMVEISGTQKKLVHRTVDPKVYSAWKDNEWILDGLTLDQVAERIEETYGLRVVVRGDAPDTKVEITGVVPTDNLETLLSALSAAFNMKFEQRGHEVLIE